MNNNSAEKHEPQMSTTEHQTDTSREICNGLSDEPLLPTQAEATTTAQNDNDKVRAYLTEKKNKRPNVGQKFYTVSLVNVKNSAKSEISTKPDGQTYGYYENFIYRIAVSKA